MKIAIIGSREGFSESFIRCELWSIGIDHIKDCTIITGGARGVDTYAEKWAEDNFLETIIIRPDNPTIKKDYILRNFKIVDMSDYVIAFWDGESRGTKSVIDYATKKNKKLTVVRK